VALVVTVIVEVADGVMAAGLNVALTPTGKPCAVKLTVLSKPLMGLTMTV
jgi:hypothetical protein